MSTGLCTDSKSTDDCERRKVVSALHISASFPTPDAEELIPNIPAREQEMRYFPAVVAPSRNPPRVILGPQYQNAFPKGLPRVAQLRWWGGGKFSELRLSTHRS